MKPISIIILESDAIFADTLKSSFTENDSFELCAISDNGTVGVQFIEQLHPDVVLLNMSLIGMDGFGVLDYVKEKKLNCKTVVVSSFTSDQIISSAISHGANYYFIKPVDPYYIAERIKDIVSLTSNNHVVATEVRDKRKVSSLDEKISNIFISIGIPPHIKGYSYLREGIKMAVENPSIINNVTKELYPNIGKFFDTSASKVERAIRHAIEVAWNRGRIDSINAIFGARVYIGNERPTNSEFIALVADKLLLEELL